MLYLIIVILPCLRSLLSSSLFLRVSCLPWADSSQTRPLLAELGRRGEERREGEGGRKGGDRGAGKGLTAAVMRREYLELLTGSALELGSGKCL